MSLRSHQRERITREVLDRVRRAGFALAGIAPGVSAQRSKDAAFMREWLAQGRHGTMDYLERDMDLREDPRGHLHDARCFVMVGDIYQSRSAPRAIARDGYARIARYALGRNYHDVMKRRLHRVADALREELPGSDFRTFVDTAPVMERRLALEAGLGWQGKNTMLIHPRLGSYFFLGGMATNLDLVPASGEELVADACGTCTRCIDACPTGAIEPYTLNASRCISYLTIERDRGIDTKLQRQMGDWIFGCDVCQDVCPHNSPRSSESTQPHDAYTPRVKELRLDVVSRWTTSQRDAAFLTTAMKRATLAMMRRNAAIAMGNQRELSEADVRALLECAGDSDSGIAHAARESLRHHGISCD